MFQTKKKNNKLENAYSNTIKAVDNAGTVGKIIPTPQKYIAQAPIPTPTPTETPIQTPTNLKSTYGGVQGLEEYKNLVNQKTSALSNLNQANQLAMKYADNTALAQGYATQGAMLQNNANLQSAYINQAGGINQNFQNQLGALEDKNVDNNFDDFSTTIANQLKSGTLTEQSGNALLQAYASKLPQGELDKAQLVLNDALAMQNKESADTLKSQESELTNNVITNFGGITPEHQTIIDKVGKGEITPTQAIQQIYQSQGQGGNTTGVVDSQTNKTTYTEGDKEYSVNTSSIGNKTGDNVEYQVGNTTYKVQLGGVVNSPNVNPKDYEVGKFYLYKDTNGVLTDRNRTYIITKDSNGVVRVVTNRGSGKGFTEGLGGTNTDLHKLAVASGLYDPNKELEEYFKNITK